MYGYYFHLDGSAAPVQHRVSLMVLRVYCPLARLEQSIASALQRCEEPVWRCCCLCWRAFAAASRKESLAGCESVVFDCALVILSLAQHSISDSRSILGRQEDHVQGVYSKSLVDGWKY